MLWDVIDDEDWEMFQSSSNDINKFVDVTVSFIAILAKSFTPTETIWYLPNQKPWVDKTPHDAVNTRS